MMDNISLIDSIIVDLNAALGALHSGQQIAFCSLIGTIGQKLGALKKDVQDEDDAKISRIKALKAQIIALTEPKEAKGDENNGTV